MSPLKSIGVKDEPNIVFYVEIVTISQHGTQNVDKYRTAKKKPKYLSVTCGSLWFSPDTPVSYTNKNDRHNITEMLLKVA
jgi:hypothetical protein